MPHQQVRSQPGNERDTRAMDNHYYDIRLQVLWTEAEVAFRGQEYGPDWAFLGC